MLEENKSTAVIALLVVLTGGGNAALTGTTTSDLREIRRSVDAVVVEAQLLNWRVYQLENGYGSRQRQQGPYSQRLPDDEGWPGG